MAFVETSNSQLERTLREDLEEKIAKTEKELAQGFATDHAFYRDQCGYIRGLRYALETLTEVNRKLNRG